jgi:hypothetical protein
VRSAYAEALPRAAPLPAPFEASRAREYVVGALAARYPIGRFILEGGIESSTRTQSGDCFTHFLRDTSSASSVLYQAETLVHECGHAFDLGDSIREKHAYHIRTDLTFTCAYGGASTINGRTFARSLLRTDAFYAMRPACGGLPGPACDAYADTYLTNTPALPQSGDAGYDMLLEEATQYVNSLATAFAFRETFSGTQASQRDGILTLLWYVARYWKLARDRYPDVYGLLSADPCWREATLTVWDRGWFFLEATRGATELGVYADAIEPLAREPSLVAEIEAIQELECR